MERSSWSVGSGWSEPALPMGSRAIVRLKRSGAGGGTLFVYWVPLILGTLAITGHWVLCPNIYSTFLMVTRFTTSTAKNFSMMTQLGAAHCILCATSRTLCVWEIAGFFT
jgi:hypothetical protein